MNTRLCLDQECWRSWSWMLLWRPTRPSRTNIENRCPFQYRGQECESRKSRDTWSNRKIWPWCTQLSRVKVNRVWPRECTGHSKYLLPTHKRRIYARTSPDWLYTEIRLIIFFAAKNEEYSQQNTRLGADCGSDHELLVAKFRLKLKKVGKSLDYSDMT